MNFLSQLPQRLDTGATPSFSGLIVGGAAVANPQILLSNQGATNLLLAATSSSVNIDTAGSFNFRVDTGSVNAVKIAATTGNLLVKGLTTDGTGAIQFATGTTSAYGLCFGADTYLYRPGAKALALDAAGGVELKLLNSGSNAGFFTSTGTSMVLGSYGALYFRTTDGGTTALTLDSSTNGSAAGKWAFNGATLSTSTAIITSAGTTGVSSLRLPHGVAPTSPVDGDVWTTTAGLFIRINGGTVGPLS